MNVRIFLVFC